MRRQRRLEQLCEWWMCSAPQDLGQAKRLPKVLFTDPSETTAQPNVGSLTTWSVTPFIAERRHKTPKRWGLLSGQEPYCCDPYAKLSLTASIWYTSASSLSMYSAMTRTWGSLMLSLFMNTPRQSALIRISMRSSRDSRVYAWSY